MPSRDKPQMPGSSKSQRPRRERKQHARETLSLQIRYPVGTQLHEMSMSTHSEAKKAKLEQPANHYKSPEEITNDADLSDEERRQALDTWEQDARQMMTASNEGMEGDDEGLDQSDTHRLGEVVRAKAKIGAKPKDKPSQ
jgi:hypothetical protein